MHTDTDKTLWRHFTGEENHTFGRQEIFGGAHKCGKLWLAAAYEDGGRPSKTGERNLLRIGVYKSRAHAYAAVYRRLGEVLAKERTERFKRYVAEHPEVKVITAPSTTRAGSIAQMLGRVGNRYRAGEVKLLIDGKEHTQLELFEHKTQGRSTFTVKRGRGGR